MLLYSCDKIENITTSRYFPSLNITSLNNPSFFIPFFSQILIAPLFVNGVPVVIL